jgi:hypothetical protein
VECYALLSATAIGPLPIAYCLLERVAHAVEADETRGPARVTSFCFRRVVAHAQRTADTVEQAWRFGIGQFVENHAQEVRVPECQRVASFLDPTKYILIGLGQVLEELPNLCEREFAGMAFAMKEDKATGPVDVALGGFGPAEMAEGGPVALVEESRRLRSGLVVGRVNRWCEGHERTSMQHGRRIGNSVHLNKEGGKREIDLKRKPWERCLTNVCGCGLLAPVLSGGSLASKGGPLLASATPC